MRPEKLLDARHARLVGAVVGRLGPGWLIVAEYSFNEYGERGSVDVLGWHAGRRALLLVEVKSELVDVQSTLRAIDIKARVVPGRVARERGWRAASLGVVLVLPDESTARRSVARLQPVFDAALPHRTLHARRWIREPEGLLRGIWFLADMPGRNVVRNPGSPGRIYISRSAGSTLKSARPVGCPVVGSLQDT